MRKLFILLLLGLGVLPLGASAREANVRLVKVGTFDSPVYVTAPRSEPDKLYVVEQAGRIKVREGGKVSTFFDISDRVLAGGEQGLLSVAFHPAFASNRLFYVDYTAKNGNTIIAEYRAGGAASKQVRVLVDLPDPASNHNGGQLVFGPDGYLWWGNGDGGGGGDQFGNGQNLARRFAKIMRLNVTKRGAAWQTWAIGLRNPWRFSFDRANGDVYIGDVGQNKYEEIDYVRRGRSHLNFGWNRFEGRARYGDETLLPGWPYVAPVAVYSHDAGCSVTGGYVDRGPAAGPLRGRYVYGDYCTGTVWSLRAGGAGLRKESLHVDQLSSFGEDARGDVYVASQEGPVYKLVG